MGKILNLLKKKELYKVDINNWYNTSVFDSAINWATQYERVPGVNEKISSIQIKRQRYCDEMKNYLAQIQPVTEKKFSVWESWEKKNNLCIRLSLGALFLLIFISFIKTFFFGNSILELLYYLLILLIIFALFAGVLITVVFTVLSNSFKKKYDLCISQFRKETIKIGEKYEYGIDSIRENMDELYLNSLPLEEKLFILRDRADERRHQEQLRAEERHHQEQLRVTELQADDQRRTRLATEKLLAIEQQREYERKSRY